MFTTLPRSALLVLLVGLVLASKTGRTQPPPPPPPVFPGDGGPSLGPPQPGTDGAPPPVFGPPVAPPTHAGDVVYPFEQPGPAWGPCGPFCPDTIFFFGAELAFVSVVAHNGLEANVPLAAGGSARVAPTRTELSWTASPRFVLGYEIPNQQGAFSLAYRFLVSEGNSTDARTPPVATRSRLDMNIIDFDYTSSNLSSRTRWELTWFLGGRLATAFYDTRNVQGTSEIKASNHFVGGGVHLGGNIRREIAVLSGWSFFGTVDAAVVVGQIQQRFTRVVGGVEDRLFRRHSQSVPVLRFETGLTYRPPEMNYLRFWLGYQFEYWWGLGNIDASRLEIATQGFFVRGEIRY